MRDIEDKYLKLHRRIKKMCQMIKEEDDREQAYQKLHSQIKFVIDTITKEAYDPEDDYKPRDIHTFNYDLREQVRKGEEIGRT